ncbi:hypothetical protein [Pseudophaeobacter sp.]|uniref:hypothetical protein n=1 Tax=Pseudophaeobacter sp. TaxID=1971739 RepID=UPI00329685F8
MTAPVQAFTPLMQFSFAFSPITAYMPASALDLATDSRRFYSMGLRWTTSRPVPSL